MELIEKLLASIPDSVMQQNGSEIRQAFERGMKMTLREQLESQVKRSNSIAGNLSGQDGYNCEKCLNRGYFLRFDEENMTTCARECSCMEIRRSLMRMKKSNLKSLEKLTFESFETKTALQKTMKTKAFEYLDSDSSEWFYIGGISGSGKTHICTAVCGELIRQGHEVLYREWTEIERTLNGNKFNQSEYNRYFSTLADTEILYIDDLLKRTNFSDNESMKNLYNLINTRYNANKRTIISSEHFLSELFIGDSATAGRIKEMCGKFVLEIPRDNKSNYRLFGFKQGA